MSAGVALTAGTFDEFVRSSDVPVLVDFWAEWCVPCKQFDTVLESVASADDRFVLASVDSDVHMELARRFDVHSVPTLVLLNGGELTWRTVGARGRSRLLDELEPYLG
jgi:thioredoxin 1